MLTTEATSLILNTAMGLIKLSKRIDLLWAEKEALQKPLALPFSQVAVPPTQPQMRRALRKLLEETKDETPDPLGLDRIDIKDTVDTNPNNTIMFGYMKTYLPEQALGEVLNLDGKFIKELEKVRPDLAADRDIVISAYYIGPGKDEREKGYTWRLALTVVDAVADFGAENTALFLRDEGIQSIVGSVLKRFGNADVQNTDSNSELLRIVLRATLNGVLDNKSALNIDNIWLNAVFDALVDARASLPAAEQDNFVVGLLQGESYPLLVGSLLEKGAGILIGDGKQNFGDVAATFLNEVATLTKQRPSFENFFQDHWGDLLRAGFSSLEQHGPALLKDSDPLLGKVMIGVLGNLARSPNNKFLTTDILVGIVDAAVSVVASNPDKVKDLVKQEWLGVLISSVSTTVARQGIQAAITKQGLETILKDVLGTFASHPELIIENPGLARDLVRDLLDSLSAIDSFTAESLATVAVSSALHTISEHPELANTKYTGLVATLAGKLATLVKAKQLTKIQGEDVLRSITESLAENPQLFLDIEKRFAGFVVDAMVKVAENSNGLISGVTLVKSIDRIMQAIASSGGAALKNHPAMDLATQLEKLLSAGLDRAQKELGNQLKLSTVPDVLGLLVQAWAKGEIATIDAANDNFRRVFTDLVIKAAA